MGVYVTPPIQNALLSKRDTPSTSQLLPTVPIAMPSPKTFNHALRRTLNSIANIGEERWLDCAVVARRSCTNGGSEAHSLVTARK